MKLSIKRIGINVILAVLFATFIAPMIGISAPILAIGIFTVGTGSQVVFKPQSLNFGLYMALQTEAWVADIQETLFFENEFLNLAVDHSEYITDKTVHIPQSGGKPTVVKNRTEDVATLQRRTDTELTYSLDNYTTDPFLVKNVEDLQISYSKRQSVMGQHIATLGETLAVNTLQAWAVNASTTHVLRTEGAATAMLPNSTATGTRNLLTYKDFARAAAIMDLDKVPKIGRFAVVPTVMFYGLFDDKELLAHQARIGKDMLTAGVVAELFNFKIITRGEVVRYTNAGANNLRDSIAANAATDCAGVICFSRFMVTQALGSIMVYLNEGDAKSFGDIMSAEVNHGASVLRNANIGRVSIAQGYTAP
jgi:hypothetical protein